ncbi:MAG: hypothetical protein V3V08_03745 [Nannocystaceae bacterium]
MPRLRLPHVLFGMSLAFILPAALVHANGEALPIRISTANKLTRPMLVLPRFNVELVTDDVEDLEIVSEISDADGVVVSAPDAWGASILPESASLDGIDGLDVLVGRKGSVFYLENRHQLSLAEGLYAEKIHITVFVRGREMAVRKVRYYAVSKDGRLEEVSSTAYSAAADPLKPDMGDDRRELVYSGRTTGKHLTLEDTINAEPDTPTESGHDETAPLDLSEVDED